MEIVWRALGHALSRRPMLAVSMMGLQNSRGIAEFANSEADSPVHVQAAEAEFVRKVHRCPPNADLVIHDGQRTR